MKKFNFTLQKVLDYKQNLQTDEKNKLAVMRRKYNEMEEQLSLLKSKTEKIGREYLEQCNNGMKAGGIQPMLTYIDTLQEQIKAQMKKMQDYWVEIDKQVDVLKLINRDIKTLEKLKEKSFEAYRKDQSKAEELFIEEFVINNTLS